MAGKFPKGPFSDVPNVQGRIAAIKCPCDETHYLAVNVNRSGWLQTICSYTRCGIDIKTQGIEGAKFVLSMVQPGNWEKGAKKAVNLIMNPPKPEPKPKPENKPEPEPEEPKSMLSHLFGVSQ